MAVASSRGERLNTTAAAILPDTPANVTGCFYIMGCITTLLAAALTAVVVWLTAFQFVPPAVVKQLSAFSSLWVLWGVTVYRALEKPMRREAVNWKTAPIYPAKQSYEYTTRHNQGRTISRTALTISARDMFELHKIAELWQINELNHRAFKAEGLSMTKWKLKMKKDGWITTNSKNEVVVLPRGRIKFRNILEGEKPPTSSVDVAQNRGFSRDTHTGLQGG